MLQQELIPHLFRTEFAKINAVLIKYFGFKHIELAEDLTMETFAAALENWPYQGVPEQPRAWLYQVAKNKAKNLVMRQDMFRNKIEKQWVSEQELLQTGEWSETFVLDQTLQMMFAICKPEIPAESQIGLALRYLCGFGIDEISSALMVNVETVNKRLFRAKQKLKSGNKTLEFPAEDLLIQRIDNVLLTLYLLFSEGYHSENKEEVIREDLCFEAMQLTEQLLLHQKTKLPQVHALYALMCFQASRLKARKSEEGTLILYQDQDVELWDQYLIAQGVSHLHISSQGKLLSKYHLEASIAYWYTVAGDRVEKWENILLLYNKLLVMQYSPLTALQRTFALSKVHGVSKAIVEAEKLDLHDNQFYHALLGYLYESVDPAKAENNYTRARNLAKTQKEKSVLQIHIDRLNNLH